MKKRSVTVLMIEDDPADAQLMREGFAAGAVRVNLHTVEDGVRALDYLRREAPYADALRPDLILLDLNLPRRNGSDILREIKSDPQLASIPVVVLTTSDAQVDALKCYGLGANSFISKPARFADFLAMIKSLEDFWLRAASLPSGD